MYELIEHKKLDAAAASITFSNIPQIYTDLVVLLSVRSNRTSPGGYIRPYVNGSTSNQTVRRLFGDGASASSTVESNNWGFIIPAANYTANTYANVSLYIPNYRSNTTKSFSIDSVGENNATLALQIITAGTWADNNPITSIQLQESDSTFTIGSSATLYGINRTQAIGKPKAIGGNITYANGYWVHTFTGSGTFYAQEDLEVDALVVAGGGGGGFFRGGGGGAGGLLTAASRELSIGSYPVLIGSGGTGAFATGFGVNGTNSSFLDLTSIGGGRGNSLTTPVQTFGLALVGGSGGGASDYANTASRYGAAGTAGQGNAGGNALSNGGTGAGGGGAGTAAANATSTVGSSGGTGIIWNGSYYAGGGGGGVSDGTPGTGGLGGGGNGTLSGSGVSGTANTGGGGGGQGNAGSGSVGGLGGSGVVIVRYKA